MLRKAMLIGAVALAVAGCGGSSPGTPTTPTPPPTATPTPPAGPAPATSTATVVIGANNTFVPQEVTVLAGGRVTFINQNNRAHDITSDPLHLHTDCPALLEVGFILPGQTKQTAPLTVARVCGFHDHMQEDNPGLRGRITVR